MCLGKEAVVRMFVKFSSTAFRCERPQQDLGSSLTEACCIIFPMHTIPKQVQTDEWGVCSGYGDKEVAPVGCSVTNDHPVDEGVTHQ
jgi:hypothetical protein